MKADLSYDVYLLSEIDMEQLKNAAEHGDAESQCALGYCYENGLHVEKDEVQALELYKASAAQNCSNGIYNVGIFTGWGKGGAERSPRKYFEYIKRAAEMGFAPAQNDLGWCYEEGIKHDCIDYVDVELAFAWYMKSAMQGHSTGITNVIRCYREGIGVQQDEDEARHWENGGHCCG